MKRAGHLFIRSNGKDSCYLEFISLNDKQITNWEILTFSSSLASDSDLNSGTSLKSFKYKTLPVIIPN